MLPKVITLEPSKIIVVYDAFDPHKAHVIFPTKEKNWTEHLQAHVMDN